MFVIIAFYTDVLLNHGIVYCVLYVTMAKLNTIYCSSGCFLYISIINDPPAI